MLTKDKRVKTISKLNVCEFLKDFGIWLIGIALSFIPLIYSFINSGTQFWLGLDMYFISVSASFLIILQFFVFNPILKNKSNKAKKFNLISALMLITISASLILVYSLLFFCEDFYGLVTSTIILKMNLVLLGILIVFGFLMFFKKNTHKGKRKII